MLRPLLIIGVGGSGGKTIRAMKQTLLRRLQETGQWGKDQPLPQKWQFLQIDTTYDGQDFPAPMLPHSEVAVVVNPDDTFAGILAGLEKLGTTNADKSELLAGWGIESFPGAVGKGAGMIRGVGRQVGIAQANAMLQAITTAVGKMESANISELMNVATVLGKDPSSQVVDKPEVLLITSLSGGSGAGMFIDVAEILKRAYPGKAWAKHITSFLYTAEVFEGLAAAGAVNQNSLGAMNEIISGFYQGPTERTNALMARLAVPKVSADHDHTGSRVNVLIGSRNDNGINIAQDGRGSGMDEVFLTIGETLGHVFLDPKMSEFFYNQALVNTASKDAVKDESGFSSSDPNTVMPFFSIGFGRLTLGADRVTDYVTDALTYEQVRKLRYPDLEKSTGDRTPTEVVESDVLELWGDGFLHKLNLDEKGEVANDVTSHFLVKDLDQMAARFASAVLQPLTEAEKPLEIATVAKRTWGTWQSVQDKHLQELKTEINLIARDWCTSIQKSVCDIVADQIASSGLKVTAGLLQRVIKEVSEVHELDLPREVSKAEDATKIVDPGWWYGKLVDKAEGKQGVSVKDRAFKEAIERQLTGWFKKVEEAYRKRLVCDLLLDLQNNFLEPLHNALIQNYGILARDTDSSKPEDNEGLVLSKFPLWENPVPPQYRPRAIEQTLIEPDEFKTFYLENAGEDLTSTSRVDKWRISVHESLLGLPLHNPEPKKSQQLVTISRPWSPRSALSPNDIPAKAQFELNVGLAKQQKNTRHWLYAKGSSYSRVHKLAIRDYVLTENLETRRSREDSFVEKASRMIQISSPLTMLNQTALNSLSILDVSSARRPNQTLKDGAKLPFGPNDDIFSRLQSTLQMSGVDVSSPTFIVDWFDDSSKTTSLYAISVPEGPLPAFAFASLTKPIAKSILSASTSPALWNSYFSRRRTRPMLEAIPMQNDMLMSILSGWIVAKAFGLVEQNKGGSIGLELSIWNPTLSGGPGFSSFPSPLLEVSPTDSKYKLHISSVLLSMGIAMVNFGETGEDQHTHAYRFLKFLGREVTTFKGVDKWDYSSGDKLPSNQIAECSLLKDWLINGKSEPFTTTGSEFGLASRAFENSQQRIDALISYLDDQTQSLTELWNQLTTQPWTNLPTAWEIRSEISEAIRIIRDYTEAQRIATVASGGLNL